MVTTLILIGVGLASASLFGLAMRQREHPKEPQAAPAQGAAALVQDASVGAASGAPVAGLRVP